MPKPESDITQIDKELDAILSSDDALKTALQSDDPIVKTAARLTNNRHPTLSATARQNILASVLDATPTTTTPPNVIKGNFVGWLGRVAAIFIITIMVGLAAQPASANSLPGDALYPVKLGFETLELAFADSPTARVQTHLNHANERLREVQQLDPESDLRDDTLHSAITSFNLVATIASDNAIFQSNSSLLEEAKSTLSNFEQALSNNQIPSDLFTDVQLSLTSIRALLPANSTDIIEVTPDVSSEANVIEQTPEVTTEVITAEVTEEPTLEVITAEITEEPPIIIPLDQVTYYVHEIGRVNVRSGAGTNFEIIGVANQNTPVTVLSQSSEGDWLEVRLPNGLEGWVFSQLLDNTPGRSNAGNANSNSSDNANENSNGNANGGTNGNANGNNNGNNNNNSSNANGGNNGNANGNNNSNANGNSESNANGNSNNNANGGGNGNANGNNNSN